MKLGSSKEKAPKIILGAPPIVDLTPPRQREARGKRELQRKWVGAVSAIALVTIVAIAAGFGLKLTAQNSYNDEVKTQQDLVSEVAKYKEVDEAIATTRDLEMKRQTALSSEIAWDKSIERIEAVLPAGVDLVGFAATGGGDPALETGVGMSFIARISSDTPIAYSEVLYLFSGIEGLSDVQVGDLAGDPTSGRYTYSVAFGFDNSVLTKRFVPAEETAETPIPTEEEN